MDYWVLLFWILLGIPILIQYFYLLPKKTPVDDLWVNMPVWLRYIYMGMIILSSLCGFYMVYYTLIELPKYDVWGYEYKSRSRWYVYLALFLILFFSNFWWSMFYLKKPKLVTSALVLVGIGSIMLMSQVWNSVLKSDLVVDKIALVSTFVLMLQMALMDGVLWNVFYWLK